MCSVIIFYIARCYFILKIAKKNLVLQYTYVNVLIYHLQVWITERLDVSTCRIAYHYIRYLVES